MLQVCLPELAKPGRMLVLVTGAAGFVGMHVSLGLHGRGDGARVVRRSRKRG